jgi:hypothetical protein
MVETIWFVFKTQENFFYFATSQYGQGDTIIEDFSNLDEAISAWKFYDGLIGRREVFSFSS